MAVSDIITVNITVQDASPAVANFGRPLILAKHGNFVGGRLYDAGPSGLAAMVTDGFTVNDRAYHIAEAISAQNPGTDKFYVYERGTGGNVQTVDLTPINVTEGFVYEFQVRPSGQATTTTITRTVPGASSVAAEVTAIQLLLDAVTGVDASDDTTHITITPTTTDTFVYVDFLGKSTDMTLKDNSADAGIATDAAAAAVDFGDNFYGVLADGFGATEGAALGAWALSNNKIAGLQCADSDIIIAGSSDLASVLQAATNASAYACYSKHMSGDLAAGLMGRQFSRDPGSTSWFFKAVAGVTADNLTSSEFSLGDGKEAMMYVNDKGLPHTSTGRAASGRSLETTRGVAFMKDQIEAGVLQVFANNEKLGFDNPSVALLEAAVRGVLTTMEQSGFILPAGGTDGWTVTPTALADVSDVDKAAGLYDGITFHAVLTGEVEKVIVDGTVSL